MTVRPSHMSIRPNLRSGCSMARRFQHRNSGQRIRPSPANWQGKKREIGASRLEPPLGSGPYRIKEFSPGRNVVYERVKDYWGRAVNARLVHSKSVRNDNKEPWSAAIVGIGVAPALEGGSRRTLF
jgi:extracellular solute-binding protein (family 5)